MSDTELGIVNIVETRDQLICEKLTLELESRFTDIFFTPDGRRTYTGNNIRECIQEVYADARRSLKG